MKTPLGKLLDQMENNDLDINAALITKPENVAYYSGYAGGNAILFIHSLARYIIIIDDSSIASREEEQCAEFKVVRLDGCEIIEFLSQLCSKLGIHRIWFEEENIGNYALLENSLRDVQFIPAKGIISQIPLTVFRMVE